jgi:hypothetical protein
MNGKIGFTERLKIKQMVENAKKRERVVNVDFRKIKENLIKSDGEDFGEIKELEGIEGNWKF